MAATGNLLSDAGLFSRGMNQAAIDQQNIEQQQQRTKAGDIGLADMQRQDAEQQAMRDAVKNSSGSLHDIAMARADAAQQAGDADAFQKYASEAMAIPGQTTQMIAESAVRGLSQDQIEANVERMMGPNSMFDKGSLRIERRADGHVIVNGTKNGVDHPALDATALYASMQKPVILSKDQALINPYSGDVRASNVVPEAAATSNSDVYVKSGPNAGKIISKGGPKRIVSRITRETNPGTPPAFPAASKSDLPALKAIQDNVFKSPGMGSIDPQTGQLVGSQDAQQKAADAQRIYLNDRTIPPADAANAVKFGKRATGPNGEKAYFYNGRMYKMANTGQPVQQPTQQLTPEDIGDENQEVNDQNYSRGGKVNSKGLC